MKQSHAYASYLFSILISLCALPTYASTNAEIGTSFKAVTPPQIPKLTVTLKKLWDHPVAMMQNNYPIILSTAAFLTLFCYLTFKETPDKDALWKAEDGICKNMTTHLAAALKGFVNPQLRPAQHKNFLQYAVLFLDTFIIGFGGKKRGFSFTSSKIFGEGLKRKSERRWLDGELVQFYDREPYPPYGILGIIWATFTGVARSLKEFNEATGHINKFLQEGLNSGVSGKE